MSRKAYPTDVSDEEWEFVAPYLILLREDAAQRIYPLRELFDAMRKDDQSWVPRAVVAQRAAAVDSGATTGRALEEGGLL